MKSISTWAKEHEFVLSIALIVAIAALAYLPLVSQLGYYHDDWHVIAGQTSGTSIFRMFTIDRPFMGLIYMITARILGDLPLIWHLFAFAVRVAGAIAFLWLLRMLWPKERAATTLMALIFVVYPGFLQEPSANTFQNQFLGYFLAILSIALTVSALKTRNRTAVVLLTLMAMGTEGVYFLIYEYMIGLEAMRLILLWYLIQKEYPALRDKVIAVLKRWAPYLVVIGVFLIWRGLIYKSSRQATNVGLLLRTYLKTPFQSGLAIVLNTVQDFIETVFVAWGLPLDQTTSSAASRDLVISILLALAAVALILLYLRWIRRQPEAPTTSQEDEDERISQWPRDAMIIGALTTLFTLLAVIMAGRTVRFSQGFDRYTLQATMGVAMLVVGFVYFAIRSSVRVWVTLFLIAISVVTQYNNATYYRQFWNVQLSLWWQLSWRAPGIQTGTVLMPLLPQGYRLSEDFEIWAPAKLIYDPTPGPLQIVSEVLNSDTARQVMSGELGSRDFRTIQFQRDFKNALIASMTVPGACLHVLDANNLELSGSEDPLIYEVAAYSHINRIATGQPSPTPPSIVFGAEPPHGWCYFYQKADLARQEGDWQTIVRLGDQAAAQGLKPGDPSEWIPFLEGYAAAGDMAKADQIASALKASPAVGLYFCPSFKVQNGSLPQAAAQYVAGAVCQVGN